LFSPDTSILPDMNQRQLTATICSFLYTPGLRHLQKFYQLW